MLFEIWIWKRILGPTPCCKDPNTKANRLINLIRHYLLYTLAMLVFVCAIYVGTLCNASKSSIGSIFNMFFAIFFSLHYLVYYVVTHVIMNFNC